MFEEARALRGMIEMFSMTQAQIAKKLGVSQSYIANKIRLLNFPEYIQRKITDANLSERHARMLLKLKESGNIEYAIEKITAMKLSVAASEILIDNMLLESMPKSINICPPEERISKLEEIISASVKSLMACGLKVNQKVDFWGKKQYITICIEK
jgi:ParB family chromosome partitioning protein